MKIIKILALLLIFSSASAANHFTGTWETVWGNNNKVKISFKQKGNKVTGYYPYKDGYIAGTVNKNGVLNGTWKEIDAKKSGTLQFSLSKNKKSFAGKYRHGKSGKWKARWNGKLKSKKVTIGELKKGYKTKKKIDLAKKRSDKDKAMKESAQSMRNSAAEARRALDNLRKTEEQRAKEKQEAKRREEKRKTAPLKPSNGSATKKFCKDMGLSC